MGNVDNLLGRTVRRRELDATKPQKEKRELLVHMMMGLKTLKFVTG